MMIGLSLLLPSLLFAADPEPPWRVVAQADWNDVHGLGTLRTPQQFVLRSADELLNKAATGLDKTGTKVGVGGGGPGTSNPRTRTIHNETAHALKVKEIDWKKQMLVGVGVGLKTTGGYRVEVTGAQVKGKKLVVSWKLHEPKGRPRKVVTYPAVVALVPRFAGKVVFDPPLKK
jgi:hypothetical protein